MKKRSKYYRQIWEKHNDACILPGMHVHHIDGNRTNDDPNNLMVCTPEEHAELHRQMGDKILSTGFILKANNGLGKPRSEEVKQKISNSKKGIATMTHTDDSRLKISKKLGSKKFNVYKKKTGEYVGTWTNISKCARDLNLNRGNLSGCVSGRAKSISGYITKYVGEL